MMDVDVIAAHEQIHIGHCLCHDEKYACPREHKSQDEAEQRPPRQFVRRLATDMVFVHDTTSNTKPLLEQAPINKAKFYNCSGGRLTIKVNHIYVWR